MIVATCADQRWKEEEKRKDIEDFPGFVATSFDEAAMDHPSIKQERQSNLHWPRGAARVRVSHTLWIKLWLKSRTFRKPETITRLIVLGNEGNIPIISPSTGRVRETWRQKRLTIMGKENANSESKPWKCNCTLIKIHIKLKKQRLLMRKNQKLKTTNMT